MKNSNISHHFQADIERGECGNSFWEVVYTFCTGPIFPAQKKDLYDLICFDLQPHVKVFIIIIIYCCCCYSPPLEYRNIYCSFQNLKSF